jgi:hypothetical protein
MQFDCGTVILVVVVIVLVYNVVFPMFAEGFDASMNPSPSQTSVDPKSYNTTLNQAIKDSQFPSVPNTVIPPWGNNMNDYGEVDILDDGLNGNAGLNFNMCSPSCCSPQYPTPFPMPADPLVCSSKQESVPSSYTCNNAWQNSGCLCMTKQQALFMNNRGNNGHDLS